MSKLTEFFKYQSVFRDTFLISIFALLSQILGFVRDLVLARFFGLGEVLDIYYMAFKIPDFMSVLYTVFLGSVIFVPLLTKAKKKGEEYFYERLNAGFNPSLEKEKIRHISDISSPVLSFVFVSLLTFFAAALLFMPYISQILAPNWTVAQQMKLGELSRLLILAQFFFPIGIFAGCVAMVYGRSFYMAVAGAVYNFSILICTILLAPFIGIYGVVIGVVLGSIFFALVQILPKEVRAVFKSLRFVFSFKSIFNFLKVNFTRFVAVTIYQSYALMLSVIAGLGSAGTLSKFTIAYFLYLSPFHLLGGSLGTALMPKTSRQHIDGDIQGLRHNLTNSIISIFIVATFIGMLLIIFARDIVNILYHFTNVSSEDKAKIAISYTILLLSFPLYNVLEVIRKYLYSRHNIKLATTFTAVMLFATGSVFLLFKSLNSQEILYSLSFAVSISIMLTTIFLFTKLLRKREIDFIFFVKSIYKPSIASALTYFIYQYFNFTKVLSFGVESIFSLKHFIMLFVNGVYVVLLFVIISLILRDKILMSFFKKVFKE